MTALVIADLEGVAGVDDATDLAWGGRGHDAARAAMAGEVAVVCRALLASGWDRVRVSDSHRSGSGQPNLDPLALPPGAVLEFRDDAYEPELFDLVDAVACVGMHAGGRSRGFGAHTVQLNTAWRCGFRLLSEVDLVLALAREVNAKVLFVSGDDALMRSVHGRAPYVLTKRALSCHTARSFPRELVHTALDRAARAAPAPVPPAPRGPIAVEDKVSGQVAHARGATFRERYHGALQLAEASSAGVAAKVDGEPGTLAFAESAARLLAQPWR